MAVNSSNVSVVVGGVLGRFSLFGCGAGGGSVPRPTNHCKVGDGPSDLKIISGDLELT